MTDEVKCPTCGGAPHTAYRPVEVVEAFLPWYARLADEDAAMVWAKAKEYGGFDHHARAMHELMHSGFGVEQAPTRLALERAIAFNVSQKLARITAALGGNYLPSEDSWRDLACYAMIARRIREVGTWPA